MAVMGPFSYVPVTVGACLRREEGPEDLLSLFGAQQQHVPCATGVCSPLFTPGAGSEVFAFFARPGHQMFLARIVA